MGGAEALAVQLPAALQLVVAASDAAVAALFILTNPTPVSTNSASDRRPPSWAR